MAIRLSETYPGQVDTTTDPTGYPHGQPRNRGAVDTNDGTPFEAAWMSDVHGFLQALLAEAAITPSDNPDKVGASQYMEAVRQVVRRAGIIDTYDEPVQRTTAIGLREATMHDGAVEFLEGPLTGISRWQANDSALIVIAFPLRLPHGATIKSVDVAWVPGTSGDQIRLELQRQPFADEDELLGDVQSEAGSSEVTDTIDAIGHTVDNAMSYFLLLSGGAESGVTKIHGLRVTWDDPGPRNH